MMNKRGDDSMEELIKYIGWIGFAALLFAALLLLYRYIQGAGTS